MKRLKVRFFAKWFGINVGFVLAHPAMAAVLPTEALGKSLLVNAVLFVLPGMGWNTLVLGGTSRTLGVRLFQLMLISTAALILALLLVRAFGFEIDADTVLIALWLITNAGFLLTLLAGRLPPVRRVLLPREAVLGTLVFTACYSLYYWGATNVVPRQLDHDVEIQATGYSLMHRFEPMLLTDRGGLYYFAHPPLLHFYVGASFLLHGKLEDLRFFDDVSQKARQRREGRHVPAPEGQVPLFGTPGLFEIVSHEGVEYVVAPVGGGEHLRVPADRVDTSRILARYIEQPFLLETRTPNIFLAAATVALLAVWVGRLSRRWWLGALIAVAYATSTEVFVRSSYGGYFALGGFLTVLMLILAGHRWRRRSSVLAGAMSALADHKLVFLPIAESIRSALNRTIPPRKLWSFDTAKAFFPPLVIGFGIGTALFWAYGFTVAPEEFYQDHIRQHLVNRVAHINDLGYTGYPGPVDLWQEFVEHTGYILLPLAMLLIGADLTRQGSILQFLRSSRGLWMLYIVLTAVPFTFVDWRMTKHIIPIVLPLHLAITPHRHAAAWRVVVPAAAAVLLVIFNVLSLGKLVANFNAYPITPDW